MPTPVTPGRVDFRVGSGGAPRPRGCKKSATRSAEPPETVIADAVRRRDGVLAAQTRRRAIEERVALGGDVVAVLGVEELDRAKQSSKDSSDEIRGAKSVSPFVRAGVPLPHVADICGRRGDRVAPRRGRRGPRGAASPGGRPTATSRASRRAAPPKPLRRGRRDSSRATDARRGWTTAPSSLWSVALATRSLSTATRGDRAASLIGFGATA